MSNISTKNTSGPSAEDVKNPQSKLESLPREELIKFIKKQMFMNQKIKTRCEELGRENESLKAKLQENSEVCLHSPISPDLECITLKQTSMEAAYQSTVEELNKFITKNKDLENQLASTKNELAEEMKTLKSTNAKLLNDIEHEKESRLQLKEKLADWEKMMKMLEKERDDIRQHLDEVRKKYVTNSDVIESIIKSVESVASDRDMVSEISSLDLPRHSSRNTEKVDHIDLHSEFVQMEQNLAKRLNYLSSITACLVFERDEVKERIQHFISEILKLEPPIQTSIFNDNKLKLVESNASLLETVSKIEASVKALYDDLSNKTHELNLAKEKSCEFINVMIPLEKFSNDFDVSEKCQPFVEHVQERIVKKTDNCIENFAIICSSLLDHSEENMKEYNIVKEITSLKDAKDLINNLEDSALIHTKDKHELLMRISELEILVESLRSNASQVSSLQLEIERLTSKLSRMNCIDTLEGKGEDLEFSQHVGKVTETLKDEGIVNNYCENEETLKKREEYVLKLEAQIIELETKIGQLILGASNKNVLTIIEKVENETSRTLLDLKSQNNISRDMEHSFENENLNMSEHLIRPIMEAEASLDETNFENINVKDSLGKLTLEVDSVSQKSECISSSHDSHEVNGRVELNSVLSNIYPAKLKFETSKENFNKTMEMNSLKKEIDSLQTVETIRSLWESVISELDIAQMELNSTKAELNLAIKDLDLTRTNLESIRMEFEFKQTECESLKAEYDNIRAELAQEKELLKYKTLKPETTETLLKSIKDEFKNVELSTVILDIGSKKLKSNSAEAVLSSKDSELKSQNSEIQHIPLKLKDLRSAKELTEFNFELILVELKITKEELQMIKTILEETRVELTSTKSVLESRSHLLQKTIFDLEAAETSLESARIDSDLNNSQLKSVIADLENCRIELKSVTFELELTSSRLKSEIVSLEDDYHSVKLENKNLKDILETKSDDLQRSFDASENDKLKCSYLKDEFELKKAEGLKEQSELKENDSRDIKESEHINIDNKTLKIKNSSDELLNLKSLLKEKDEREIKMKQLLLRSKKDIADLKNRLELKSVEMNETKSESSYGKSNDQSVSLLYQNLQTEYEKLEALYDDEKSRSSEMSKLIDKLNSDLGQAKVKMADAAEELDNLREEFEGSENTRRTLEEAKIKVEKDVQLVRIQLDVINKEKMSLESKVAHMESQLMLINGQHHSEMLRLDHEMKTKLKELENARKNAQHSQVMSLEIADYERSVRSLNLALEEKDVKVMLLKEELHHLHQQKNATTKLLESSENQFRQSEEQCLKMKQMLLKSKKELADVRKQEGERLTCESHLKTQNEMLKQMIEEQKLKIADLISESCQLSDRLSVTLANQQRTDSVREMKLVNQQREAELCKLALDKLQSDYDGYKVRVHSVLKLKKNTECEETALAGERNERERLEHVNNQMKVKLMELSSQLTLAVIESEQLKEEHERMMEKQVIMKVNFDAAENAWKEKLENLVANHVSDQAKQTETIQQLMMQNESMAQTFKEQHACVVESLKSQLDKAQFEVDRCRTKFQNVDPSPPTYITHSPNTITNRFPSLIQWDGAPEERQAAEGSEYSEDVQQKLAGSPVFPVQRSFQRSSFVPLEVLLSGQSNAPSEVDEDEKCNKTQNSSLLASQMQGAHLRQLLNESEATVLRLTEQASILKSEIRRLERNQERQSSVSNMEYLKNVVYKFLTLKNVEERLQLIPVMQTMLKFSPEEKEKVTSIAKGMDSGGDGGAELSGWSSYIKWPGLAQTN